MATCSSPSSFLLLFYSIVIFASMISAAEDNRPEAVLDVAGNKVQSGVKYHILPVLRGRFGGLTLAPNRNGSCPFDVVQDRNPRSNGLPLTFSPVDNDGIVRTITDQNIEFSEASTICAQSTVWKLADFDESIRKSIITTGGTRGNPGRETLSNWFKIEKYEDHYKLVFCPSVCIVCSVLCDDIGVYMDNGVPRLAVTGENDEPLKVMFRRV